MWHIPYASCVDQSRIQSLIFVLVNLESSHALTQYLEKHKEFFIWLHALGISQSYLNSWDHHDLDIELYLGLGVIWWFAWIVTIFPSAAKIFVIPLFTSVEMNECLRNCFIFLCFVECTYCCCHEIYFFSNRAFTIHLCMYAQWPVNLVLPYSVISRWR
jgi:hypothetical protein